MSEELKLSSMYLLVKEIPATDDAPGTFQFALASEKKTVQALACNGFRAFQLTSETIFETLNMPTPVIETPPDAESIPA